MANQKSSQTIEQLQSRYDQLNKQKIQVETQRESAVEQLNKLKAQAEELYGSDDVEQLKKILADMKSANQEKRSQYEASLNSIDKDLAAINENFSEEEIE